MVCRPRLPKAKENRHARLPGTAPADHHPPEVFGGKPIVRDLRILVELILILLCQGVTPEAILEDYPALEPEDLRAFLAYAHAAVAGKSAALGAGAAR